MKQTSRKLEPIVLLVIISFFTMCYGSEIKIPVNYTALNGDLEIYVQNLVPQEDPYYLQLLEYYSADNSFTIIGSTLLQFDNSSISKAYKAMFPCGLISQGGRYAVRIQPNYDNDVNEILITEPEDTIQNTTIIEETNKKVPLKILNVLWPLVNMSLEPLEIETYPSTTVTALIKFQTCECEPSIGSLVPETWISLIYCGHSPIECKFDNISHKSQILYSEQIRGYPILREISLQCQFFGQAGYYTMILTSGIHATGTLIASMSPSAVLKVKWSENFVFNVHTRSIFQCDAHGGGVAVLFQYPDCILTNDKVRLFGSLRADVASLLPLTSLHYITEQKVIKGKYSLQFDCDLFSEKYVEYCFVYVNQAITGAVSDVRMDCVPTFPISDKDSGQWSNWSDWSECSSTCKGGTRNRYRFCDSPLPKYGAKYCEGHTVETEECGYNTSWDCQLYNNQLTPEILAEKPEIQEVIGEKCKCGCVIHLDKMIPQRFLAASLRNCSQKTLWKIQADRNHTIQLYMNRVHFPCITQKLKIHDGEHISSNLLAQFTSTDALTFKNISVMSSGSVILLEYSISENLNNNDCLGGFLCHFQQKAALHPYISRVHAESMSGEMPVEAVHVAILLILVVVVSMSFCMMIQYVNRYHKYQRTSMDEDIDFENSETCSKLNLTAVMSHETSTSTLISEIIPLKKLCKGRILFKTKDFTKSHGADYSTQSENDDNIAQTKHLIENNQVEQHDESNSTLHTFRAEVHNENRSTDGSANYQISSPNNSNTLESNNSYNSHKHDNAASNRRPSLCTRISLSPTLSNNTNTVSSPNSSLKGSTLKRVKDMRNQEKVNVGSDFSLTGQDTDLEMDYYDYNVLNTNTIPGSYLGMDPAYYVWIPPFAPGQWIDNGSDGNYSSNDEIEMKTLSSCQDSESRSETPTEKFQTECKISTKNKEKFNRYSFTSIASSSNKTIIPEDISPDEILAIKDALLPDTPIKVQNAIVLKDVELAVKESTMLVDDDLKFADEDDSDTAYNSEDNDIINKKYKKPSLKKARRKIIGTVQ